MFHLILNKIRSVIVDRRGNVAVLMGLCALPLFGLIGLVIDYALATATKAKMDMAADAAAISALTTAQNEIAANSGASGNALTDGAVRGKAAFMANMGALSFAGVPTISVQPVTRTGQTLTETVTYSLTQTNNFGKLFNAPTTQIVGRTTASSTIGSYLDFYLLLDVSGSMGLPSTTAGQTQLASINRDNSDQYPNGCNFACHMSPYTGFNLARANKIQLRADAVGSAVCQLMQTAKTTATLTNQFRVGLYPFIVKMESFYPLSANLDGVMSAVNGGASNGCSSSTPGSAIGNLLDTGDTTSAMGAGGTHFENAFPEMSSTIASVGDGSSSSSTKPFVFLITDGMDNGQGYQGSNSSVYWWSSGSQPQLMDATVCTTLKTRGITVAVLNITYQPIVNPNHGYANDEDGKANNLISGTPSVASTLQSCASPGYYFTANTPDEITQGLNNMFAQAVQKTRIIN